MCNCILYRRALHVQLSLLACVATCLSIIFLRGTRSQPQTEFTHVLAGLAFNAFPRATFGSFHAFQALPFIVVQHPHSLCEEFRSQALRTFASTNFGCFSPSSAGFAFATRDICPHRLRPFPWREFCCRFSQVTRATLPPLYTILTHSSC